MVRTVLHMRIPQISPVCPICSKEDETLEHHFLLCPIARVVWFGSELSLRINHLRVQKIKDWIGEWLSKPKLQKIEAFWFYGQLVCNLWCISIHRNEVIFNNKSPDPRKIISHQNFLLQWILKVNHENTQKQNFWPLRYNHSTNEQSTNTRLGTIYEDVSRNHDKDIWLMFIEIRKVKGINWYGLCAFIRNPKGFCIIINISLYVDSQRHVELIILCEALVHLKEFGVSKIICKDPKNRWRKLLTLILMWIGKYFLPLLTLSHFHHPCRLCLVKIGILLLEKFRRLLTRQPPLRHQEADLNILF